MPGHDGHHHVADHDIGVVLAHQCQGLVAIFAGPHVEAFEGQHAFQVQANVGFVLCHHDACVHVVGPCAADEGGLASGCLGGELASRSAISCRSLARLKGFVT